MVKLSILYRQPESHDEFETFYNTNLALMERIPGVARRQVNMVFGAPGGPSPFYRVLELYFEDYEVLDQAMRTPEGEAAGRHLMMYAADLVEMFFSEVYEEEGGSTPQQDAQDSARSS